MEIHRIKKGYDIPLQGAPERVLKNGAAPASLGMHPIEFRGVKPRLLVASGDAVKIGTPLFCDKTAPDILF